MPATWAAGDVTWKVARKLRSYRHLQRWTPGCPIKSGMTVGTVSPDSIRGPQPTAIAWMPDQAGYGVTYGRLQERCLPAT